MLWVQFVACVLIVLFAGAKVAQYADVIAEKTRLGRLWVGTLILGVVTSMPELVTSVSSVTLVHHPNLGLGTLIGSCIFNLCIIAIIDIKHKDKSALSIASNRHVNSLAIGIVLAIVVGVGVLLNERFAYLRIGYASLPGIVILLIYITAFWRISKQKRDTPPDASLLQYEHTSGRFVWLKLALASSAIIGAGIWLSYVGDQISIVTGWGTTFVGSLLIAITTSLPELTVAIVSERLGAIDLAIGDILGANLLDLTYIFFLDLLNGNESIFARASQSHLVTLSLLVVMNTVLIVAFKTKMSRKMFKSASWYSPLLIILYIAGTYILYISST
jgi:cation:H+ antiporter